MLPQLSVFHSPGCNAEEASIRCGFGVPVAVPNPDTKFLKLGAVRDTPRAPSVPLPGSQRTNGDADDNAIRESFFAIHETG